MTIVKAPVENPSVNAGEIVITPLHGARNMGSAIFAPGSRGPAEGMTSHAEDEYAYTISGSIKCFSGGKLCEMKAGDTSFIPAGEEHYSYNDSNEPCTLVYVLVKKN